ncbi:MAG: anion permease [Clostridiales Family XIII bacterium]|nr:anion permease [Clostridiales Family XIII bacterium]
MKKLIGFLAGVIVVLLFALVLPATDLLPRTGLIALGCLIGAVVWILSGAIPEFLAMLGMCLLFVIFKIAEIPVAFASFSSATWWMMVGAFGIAAAANDTGLLRRIAVSLMNILPATFKGQCLAYIISGLIASPIVPSSTAKAVIGASLAQQTSEAMGFEPGSKGARGLYIAMFTGYVSVALGFLSGSAVNVAIVGIMPKGFEVSWTKWFIIGLPWMIIATILMILCIFKFYQPKDAKTMPKEVVKKQLEDLGPISTKEKITLIVVLCALLLWITEPWLKIPSAMVSCGAFIVLLSLGCLSTQSFRSKTSWESLIFVGCFLCLPTVFAETGVNAAIKAVLGPIIGPMFGNIFILAIFLAVLTYIVRLLIVSLTGSTILIGSLLLPFCLEAGIHPFIMVYMVYVSTNTWNLSFQNTTEIAARAVTDNKMVRHKDVVGGSVMYMVTNIVAILLSIPIWKLMGYL